jgi:hypothetical protein
MHLDVKFRMRLVSASPMPPHQHAIPRRCTLLVEPFGSSRGSGVPNHLRFSKLCQGVVQVLAQQIGGHAPAISTLMNGGAPSLAASRWPFQSWGSFAVARA